MNQNYKKGYCDVCESNIQFDKVNQQYYCTGCDKRWSEDTWDLLVEVDRQNDIDNYKFKNINNNLSALNRL